MSPRTVLARLISRIWGSIYEPRSVTATMVVTYVVATLLGLALVVLPAGIPLGRGGWIQHVAGGFFLTGLVGAPAAWRGAWWIERAPALACMGGAILSGLLLLAVHPSGDPLVRAITWTGITFVTLFFLTRFLRVRTRAHAPGHGPLSVEERDAARGVLGED